jgi:hypothetical protein
MNTTLQIHADGEVEFGVMTVALVEPTLKQWNTRAPDGRIGIRDKRHSWKSETANCRDIRRPIESREREKLG